MKIASFFTKKLPLKTDAHLTAIAIKNTDGIFVNCYLSNTNFSEGAKVTILQNDGGGILYLAKYDSVCDIYPDADFVVVKKNKHNALYIHLYPEVLKTILAWSGGYQYPIVGKPTRVMLNLSECTVNDHTIPCWEIEKKE